MSDGCKILSSKRVLTILVLGVTLGCAENAPNDEAAVQDSFDLVRPSPSAYVQAELVARGLATGSGGESTVLDSETIYDSRRDVWEDENPPLGEDPTYWDPHFVTDPSKVPSLHAVLHDSSVAIRKFGHQWLRSYARNATVVLVSKADLLVPDPATGETYAIRPKRLVQGNPEATARLERATQGWDLCPEQRFYDQYANGEVSNAYCSGTLVDGNLILTAAHCIRDRRGEADPAVNDIRVVFNFNLPYRSERPNIVPARDVYRVREVLSLDSDGLDIAVLQLMTDSATPQVIDKLPSQYVPVPLWDSDDPPANYQYRPGAAIGAGVGLPVKVSAARARGWRTDSTSLAIAFSADVYGGNSGGGIYDVDTGTLIGVVSNELDHQYEVNCPDDPSDIGDITYPSCRVPMTDRRRGSEPLNLVPKWDFSDPANPKWTGCMKWAALDLPDNEKSQFVSWMQSTWNLPTEPFECTNPTTGVVGPCNSVNVTFANSSFSDAAGPSLHAVRSIICDAAAAAVDVADFRAKVIAAQVSAKRNQVDSATCLYQASGCPSQLVLRTELREPAAPEDRNPVVIGSDVTDPLAILNSSALCTKVQPQPARTIWSSLPKVNVETGREMTYHGTTRGAPDYFSVAPGTPWTSPDALYAISVDQTTILYADTFSGGRYLGSSNSGTNFDTALQLWEEVGSNPTDDVPLNVSYWNPTSSEANDDTDCKGGTPAETDVNFDIQSQMVRVLEPGKRYIVQVTGYANYSGEYNLHTQTIPAPYNGKLIYSNEPFIQRTASWGETFRLYSTDQVGAPGTIDACVPNGTFDPQCMYDVIPRIECQKEGVDVGDYGQIAMSCPDFRGGEFGFFTDGKTNQYSDYTDDAVSAVAEGHNMLSSYGYMCSDDTKKVISLLGWFNFSYRNNSAAIGGVHFMDKVGGVETVLHSGSAVRAFYTHQFTRDLDWSNLSTSLFLPDDAVDCPWMNAADPVCN